MSFPKNPPPVLYFIAVTEREKGYFLKNLRDKMESELGMILAESKGFNFSEFTSYYEKEMGSPLWKTIYAFERLREPEFLIELKHLCFSLERETADSQGKRVVNLDPGYLTLSKVVLSTFKDYAHRIYLGRSVFAEVTLFFKEGSFHPFPWTYPDYQQEDLIAFFNGVRTFYKEKLDAYR